MITVGLYDLDTGMLKQRTTVPDLETAERLAAEVGLGWKENPLLVPCYLHADEFVEMPARPSAAHIFDMQSKVWIDATTIPDLRSVRIAEVDRAFTTAAAALTLGYPEAERMTWPTQQAEALAWSVDPAAPTPFLDGIAAARQIDPADMRAKTLEAVQAFMAASQVLVGTRQRLRDAVLAAETEYQIAAVDWFRSRPSS